MRTSATGRAEGFTLVELLVVLTLFGLLSASVVVALPDGRSDLRAEAVRFAARAKAARDKAMVDARPISLRVTAQGYGFYERRNGEWQPLLREPLAEQNWGDEISLSGEERRLSFDPTGFADPAQLVIARDGSKVVVSIAADGGIDVDG